jgi:hypothetical protein
MSSQTVARIVDPAVEEDDYAWGEDPFVAATPAAPAEPPARPLAAEEVADLLGRPAVNPVGAMIADVEHAIAAEDSGPATGGHNLPRIGIDVFVLQASTQDAAQRAAADRRFQRGTTVS